MFENQFERCEEDDPNRCQSNDKSGQCRYKAEEGKKYCPRHLANSRTGMEKEKVRQYRLTQWQGRVDEFADSDAIKSLRDEIGITRMMLESVLNQCENPNDLLLKSNVIGSLVAQIEKLVSSCHRLEESTGLLLDRSSVMALGQQIINIISVHVQEPESIESIATQIIDSIASQKKIDA